MEDKFKIGDVVIGNKRASAYGITKEGTVWEVSEIYDDGFIDVEKRTDKGNSYKVDPKAFDLHDKQDLISLARDRYPIGTIVNNDNLKKSCVFEIKGDVFKMDKDGDSVLYVFKSGSYTVYAYGEWADIVIEEPTSSEESVMKDIPLRFKIGDKVEISEFSSYRNQGYKLETKMVGTILETGYSSKFEYRVSWPNNTRNTYKESDLVPHQRESSVPLFNMGDKVMIRDTSVYREQGYQGYIRLVGTIRFVSGPVDHKYAVVWPNGSKFYYREEDLIEAEKPAPDISEPPKIELFDPFPIKEMKKRKEKLNKTVIGLEFQEPVIVKTKTGNKFKLITII